MKYLITLILLILPIALDAKLLDQSKTLLFPSKGTIIRIFETEGVSERNETFPEFFKIKGIVFRLKGVRYEANYLKSNWTIYVKYEVVNFERM